MYNLIHSIKLKELLLFNGYELDDKLEDNTHHIGLMKNNIEVMIMKIFKTGL